MNLFRDMGLVAVINNEPLLSQERQDGRRRKRDRKI
jgi:hypothetical protein